MCNRFLRTKKGQVGVCTFKDAIVRRAIAPTRFLANQLTLSGPGGGADFACHSTTGPPDFGRCGGSDLWIFYDHEYLGVTTYLLVISPSSSWLEPELELKNSQLDSARDLFPLSSKSKIGRKRAEILILKKIMWLNHSFQLSKTPFVFHKFI